MMMQVILNQIAMNKIDKQYYTPAIEDLFVGYELEAGWESGWRKEVLKDFNIYSGKGVFYSVSKALENDWIRTVYLTKEQIETEGWKYIGREDYHLFGYEVSQGFHNAFEKGNYVIQGRSLLNVPNPHIKIFENEGEGYQCIYQGKCPSINEFRKICKLIGV